MLHVCYFCRVERLSLGSTRREPSDHDLRHRIRSHRYLYSIGHQGGNTYFFYECISIREEWKRLNNRPHLFNPQQCLPVYGQQKIAFAFQKCSQEEARTIYLYVYIMNLYSHYKSILRMLLHAFYQEVEHRRRSVYLFFSAIPVFSLSVKRIVVEDWSTEATAGHYDYYRNLIGSHWIQ